MQKTWDASVLLKHSHYGLWWVTEGRGIRKRKGLQLPSSERGRCEALPCI